MHTDALIQASTKRMTSAILLTGRIYIILLHAILLLSVAINHQVYLPSFIHYYY